MKCATWIHFARGALEVLPSLARTDATICVATTHLRAEFLPGRTAPARVPEPASIRASGFAPSVHTRRAPSAHWLLVSSGSASSRPRPFKRCHARWRRRRARWSTSQRRFELRRRSGGLRTEEAGSEPRHGGRVETPQTPVRLRIIRIVEGSATASRILRSVDITNSIV